jgi:hypothetical protein
MSDGDSVSGILKDLAKETVKQVVKTPITIAKGVTSQAIGQDSEEKEARKKQEKAETHQRIQAIEAEIAQIRAANDKKTGPEVVKSSEAQQDNSSGPKVKKMVEASRQALGRAEQGRNFKG